VNFREKERVGIRGRLPPGNIKKKSGNLFLGVKGGSLGFLEHGSETKERH